MKPIVPIRWVDNVCFIGFRVFLSQAEPGIVRHVYILGRMVMTDRILGVEIKWPEINAFIGGCIFYMKCNAGKTLLQDIAPFDINLERTGTKAGASQYRHPA